MKTNRTLRRQREVVAILRDRDGVTLVVSEHLQSDVVASWNLGGRQWIEGYELENSCRLIRHHVDRTFKNGADRLTFLCCDEKLAAAVKRIIETLPQATQEMISVTTYQAFVTNA